jgi:hypothetical protein
MAISGARDFAICRATGREHRVARCAFDEDRNTSSWNSPGRLSRQAFPILWTTPEQIFTELLVGGGQLRGVKGRKGVLVLTDGIDNRLSSASFPLTG